jgi:hypothetical protein
MAQAAAPAPALAVDAADVVVTDAATRSPVPLAHLLTGPRTVLVFLRHFA